MNSALRVQPAFLLLVGIGCGARTGLDAPRSAEADVEICNGLDDDGDGLVDENIPPQRCGVGACAREAPGCEAGHVPDCEPGGPSPEICNRVDDDCDGAVDEELGFGPIAGPFVVSADVASGAFSNQLVATPDGMLATWRVSFDGSHPTPNTFVRPLGPDGKAIGSSVQLLTPSVVQGPRVAPAAGGSFLLTYCGRFGFDDRAASGRMDDSGALVSDHGERAPSGRSCGASDPDGIWTGSRQLFAWTSNSSSPTGALATLLDVADATGASVGWRTLHDSGDPSAPPRMATANGRVAIVTGIAAPAEPTVDLAVDWLDAAGGGASVQTLSMPLAGGQWGDALVGARASGGFVVLGANRFGPGLVRARLGAAGELVEAPAAVNGVGWRSEWTALAARPAGGFVLAGDADQEGDYRGFVMALSDNGVPTDMWFTDPNGEEPWLGFPAALVRDGRVFVLYFVTPPGVPPELRIREFGCVSP